MEPQDITLTYDSDEGQGTVIIHHWGEKGNWGPGFTVKAPDGTQYTGYIDLFHFVKADGEEPGDRENCLQIIIDPPTPPGATEPLPLETFHARMYPDGTTKAYSE